MQELLRFGWNPHFESHFEPSDGHVPGRVTGESREIYEVAAPGGRVRARLAGALRADPFALHPATGDWVRLRLNGGDEATVTGVLPRRTCLVRQAAGLETRVQVLAANVDTALVVAGLDADFNLRRLERYLVSVRDGGIEPVLVLNKADACPRVAEREALARGLAGGPVHAVSALTGLGMEALGPYLRPGRTLVVVGSSGVGKSTLLNRLSGEDVAAVGALRASDGRGRHTTTRREMRPLPSGALLIDTPGIRELSLWHGEEALEGTFPEIEGLASGCRFRDCRHTVEPGCAVREALESGELEAGRLTAWSKLRGELRHAAMRQDHRARLEERRRWKNIAREQRRHRKR